MTNAGAMLGVSFDLSKARTGMCIWIDDQPVITHSYTFKEYEYLGDFLDMWLTILSTDLQNVIATVADSNNPVYDVDWFAYEDIRPIHKVHMEQHFGMVGMLHYACVYLPAHLIPVTATEAKKTLSGYGRATKEQQLTNATNKYPTLNVKNHDEADAVAVGLHALSKINQGKI